MTNKYRRCYRNTESAHLAIRIPDKVHDTWAGSRRICSREQGGEGETFHVEGTVYIQA